MIASPTVGLPWSKPLAKYRPFSLSEPLTVGAPLIVSTWMPLGEYENRGRPSPPRSEGVGGLTASLHAAAKRAAASTLGSPARRGIIAPVLKRYGTRAHSPEGQRSLRAWT